MKWMLLWAFVQGEAQQAVTLKEVVALAMERNPELAAERTGPEGAAAALHAAKGAFDPILGFRLGQKSSTVAASSVLQGANGRLDERNSTQSTSFRQRLPWLGMTFENQLENNRISTSNPFTSLNPYYAPVWRSTFAMPLWRFRKTDEARTNLKVRRASRAAADSDFEARVLELAARVEMAYWNWVGAREAEAAARESVRYAQEALDSTTRLVRAGEQADNETAGARGQLRRSEEQAAQAAGEERTAEQQLKSLVARDAQDPIWEQGWRPADQGLELAATSAADLAERALKRRPELAAAAERLRGEKENTQLAAEARKPGVDLSLSRTTQGLAGRSVPQGSIFPGFSLDAPPELVGSYGRAYGQLWRNRYPTYEATLSIELPLRNREAEGRYGQQRAVQKRLEAQLRQLEIQTVLEVRRAWESYAAARARIAAAADGEVASRERLESELRLYREGQSNNLNLNVRQSERTASQQSLAAARRTLNLAGADLRRAAALTLEALAITVE